MNHIDLESWASRAAVELEGILKDTLEAAGLDAAEPGSDAGGVAALLDEYDDIKHNRSTWQRRISEISGDLPPALKEIGA